VSLTESPRPPVAPVFPDGVDRRRRMAPLFHSAVRDIRHGRDYRRKISRDPLTFALLYLTSYLCDETTGGISFSAMHLDIYDRLTRWRGGGPDPSAWASHRDAGKTVSWFLLAPLWAAVHAGRDFTLMLSNVGDQARPHLATLKSVIEDGDSLLVHDFPELAPARPWSSSDAVTRGGHRFLAAGMEKNVLGARHREKRPGLIVGDDLEPGEEDWTTRSKAKTLGRLINDVIPGAAPNAAVVLVGTPVGMGSLLHDVVRAARGRPGALTDRGEWLRAKGFESHWYPAITPAGGSAWQTRHPIAWLEAEQAADPATFALQMMCDPDDPAAARGWSDDTFRRDPLFDPDGTLWRIGSIDGAVTSGRDGSADHTAFVGVAIGRDGPGGRRVCVEEATSGSWDDRELLERIWTWARAYPRARKTLIVEGNQGGEHWHRQLRPLPPGVEFEPAFHVAQPKAYRIKSLLGEYRRGAVVHAAYLTGLEAQMIAWRPGASGHGVDDLIDATRAAVDRALYGDASRSPERRTR
jgi:hypothetical protein